MDVMLLVQPFLLKLLGHFRKLFLKTNHTTTKKLNGKKKVSIILALQVSICMSYSPLFAQVPARGVEILRTYLKENQTVKARILLERWLLIEPDNSTLWAYKTFCSDNPMDCAKRAVALDKSDPLGLIACGLANHQQHTGTTVGLEMLNTAIKLSPSSLAFNARGLVYASSGLQNDKQLAIADFSEAIMRERESEAAYINRADAELAIAYSTLDEHLRNSEFEKARADLERSILINPKSITAYVCLSSVHQGLFQWKQALEANSKAIELASEDKMLEENSKVPYPENPVVITPHSLVDLYTTRANIYRGAADYYKAIEDYTQVLRIAPKPVLFTYPRRAELYMLTKQYSRAVADYSAELIQLDELARAKNQNQDWIKGTASMVADLHASRSLAFLREGNVRKAREDAQTSLRYYERLPRTQFWSPPETTAHIVFAASCALQSRYEEALAAYSEIIERDPQNLDAVKCRGRVETALRKRGRLSAILFLCSLMLASYLLFAALRYFRAATPRTSQS
jgi:tetratricopeptide (TPR) repeat protein